MADRIYASVVNQKTVSQVQLQVLTLIAAQVTNLIEAQIGFTLQTDDDVIDI
ncbi:hypothetical protein [Clostridium formicaceticum]|uniref:Uncharacterized protein n=1 Tax=Clostridium formicaceticum TaxID=1497 RepID=A0AAC9RMJ3_9CLOT|nr:hypothetical protein [Clostridium formicaceticum]ARE88023.1 hypothetical protein CLFO_24240 [Clostridium formicaceticum]